MEEIKEIIRISNEFGSLITAAATVAIAILTWKLAAENRKLRKAGTEPKVIAYLSPSSTGSGAINFVLANVGRGLARDIKFHFEYEEDDFKAHDVKIYNDYQRAPLSYLPQDEKIESLFGVSYKLAKGLEKEEGKPLKPFKVKITYKNSDGRLFCDEQTIDISQFVGLSGIFPRPPIYGLEDKIGKIERHLRKISEQIVTTSHLIDATDLGSEYRKYDQGGRTADHTRKNEADE